MRFFYILILFFAAGVFLLPDLCAQSKGAVRGNLTNRKTGQIINTGKLTLIPTGRKKAARLETQPTENGTFIFREIPEGVYDLEYRNIGTYKTQRLVGLYIKNSGQKLAYFRLNDAAIGEDTSAVELIQTYASLQANKEKEVQTASLSADKLVDAPATVYLITQDDITEQGLQYLHEVLELIPGVEVQEKAHYYTNNMYTLRGVQGTKKFIILLDGVRISSFTAAMSTNDKNMFIGNAAQIEIVLGPASALYGADALTGVINIISQTPQQTSITLSQNTGRFGTQSYDLQATLKTDKVSILLNGHHYRSQEPNMPKFYPKSYDWYLNHYLPKGEMPPYGGEDTSLLVTLPIYPYQSPRTAYWVNAQIMGKKWELGGQFNTERIAGNVAFDPKIAYTTPENFTQQFSYNVYGKYFHKNAADNFSLQSLINFNANEVSPRSSFPNALGLYEQIYTYSYDRTFQTNHNIEYQINKNQKLQAGIGLNFTNALPTNYSAFPLPFSRGNLSEQFDNQYYVGSEVILGTGERFVLQRNSLKTVNQYNAGAFVQYKLSILDKLFITAGTRFDYVRQDGNKAMPGFSPKIGLVYTPNNFINLRACFGTAFLAPALDYVHADYVYAVPVVDSVQRRVSYQIPYAFLSNPNLNTEKMINGELGLSYSKNKLFIAANAYFNNVKRLIAPGLLENAPFLNDTINLAEQYTNQKGLIAYGSSLEAEYKDKFGKDEAWGIKIHANYAYNNGQIQAQNVSSKSLKLPYMAPHTVKAGITLSYKKISLNVRGIFRSPSYNGGIADVTTGELVQTANKAYFVLNTYLYYRLEQVKYGNRYTDIFIRFRNLTNQRYYNPSMNFSDVMVLAPQDPIRWSVGIRFYVLK